MIETFFQSLEGGDSSLPTALAAILAGADETGRISFDDLAVAYRSDHLTVKLRDSASVDTGDLSVDEARRHLRNSVLPRLASKGVIADFKPAGEGALSTVQLDARLLADIGDMRDDVRQKLLDTALHLRQSSETRVEVPAATGSRLCATGLAKSYKKRLVVDNVDLELRQGEIVGLLGPNGAGKTTCFYMIVGLIRPDAGQISLDGTDLSRFPMYKRARHGIGYLAQEPSVFRKLSVEDNVMAVLETMKLSSDERKERLETLLDELSIKHLRTAKAYSLSGGERRRLEITRSLATNPRFMLLDEPFAGVDPIAVNDIQMIVAGLRRRGIGVLITDHNVEQTLEIVDRAYIMFEGKVKVAGTVRDLVFDDEVADLYFGPTLTARLRTRLGEAA